MRLGGQQPGVQVRDLSGRRPEACSAACRRGLAEQQVIRVPLNDLARPVLPFDVAPRGRVNQTFFMVGVVPAARMSSAIPSATDVSTMTLTINWT